MQGNMRKVVCPRWGDLRVAQVAQWFSSKASTVGTWWVRISAKWHNLGLFLQYAQQ